MGHFRGFTQNSTCWDGQTDSSWPPTVKHGENVWNSLSSSLSLSLFLSLSLSLSLSQSQESRKFLDCQLSYFIVYADWANLTVKIVYIYFLLILKYVSHLCYWSVCPPSDHAAGGSLWPGGGSRGLCWDDRLRTHGGVSGEDQMLLAPPTAACHHH